jgi:hypothetical protein
VTLYAYNEESHTYDTITALSPLISTYYTYNEEANEFTPYEGPISYTN